MFAAIAAAQEYRGSISGVVTDSTSAVAPNVEIRVTNVETNVSSSTRSTSTGAYAVKLLEPGTYKLRAEAPGFKPITADQMRVQTAETVG